MAVSEAECMTQILQNLLDLARGSNSMMPLQSESLILNDVVADIVHMTEPAYGSTFILKLLTLGVKI